MLVPDDAAVPKEERVHRLGVRLVAELRGRELVWRRHVRTDEARSGETAHRVPEPLGRDVERDVRPVQRPRGERGVLHTRRERVRDGVTEQRDDARLAADHP